MQRGYEGWRDAERLGRMEGCREVRKEGGMQRG